MSTTADPTLMQNPMMRFTALDTQPEDGLLALIALHAADPRSDKIDLGIGVYRDADGNTPIFRSVKAAERRLVTEQRTKSYLPEGDMRFVDLLADMLFGRDIVQTERLTGLQTPGGTGALSLGAALIARVSQGHRIWMGTPTWPNHAPLFEAAGMTVQMHPFFDAQQSTLDFPGMIAALSGAACGDFVLLHGGCHNPTGVEFSTEQWSELADLICARGLIPFVDMAYHGLGNGLDEDAAGLRLLLSKVNEALVAYSCDKNFGLYRERVGVLWVMASSRESRKVLRENVLMLQRCLWSMPPDHGAAIVRTILDDDELTRDWRAELDSMRWRIQHLRDSLALALPQLAPIGRQRGIFSTLPISPADVAALRERHGIYMTNAARINIAGLTDDIVASFAATLAPFLPQKLGVA